MSMGYTGLFIGTKADKTRRFNEVENRICMLYQDISNLRSDLIDSLGQMKEYATPFELMIETVVDQLEDARDRVWIGLNSFHSSLPDYIAEGYPDLN